MKRITFLAAATVVLLLATAACSETGGDSGLMMTETLQTAVEASGSQQAAITQEASSQAESEAFTSTRAIGNEASNTGEAETAAGDDKAAASAAASSRTEPAARDTGTKTANSTGVVAKSDNVVTGEDNGKVMSELDKELDALFSSINRLEDVDRAALDGEVNGK